MSRVSECLVAIVLLAVLSQSVVGVPPMRQLQNLFGPRNKILPIVCGMDTLVFYQDCRMCVCPKPNRVAKCYRKTCDLRTKDTGQCPTSVLKLHDNKICPPGLTPGCKVDADCPGPQLCCFDFCGGTKCADPVPLDVLTGQPVHKGRGYQ